LPEVYIFASDDTGRAFAEVLSKKARMASKSIDYDSSVHRIGSQYVKAMRRAGVHLRAFTPFGLGKPLQLATHNRDHPRLLIMMTKSAACGLNVGGEYAGSWGPID